MESEHQQEVVEDEQEVMEAERSQDFERYQQEVIEADYQYRTDGSGPLAGSPPAASSIGDAGVAEAATSQSQSQ